MVDQVSQERFASRKKALVWLNDNGMKVSTGKFYQDCDTGFPAVHADKTVSKFEVMEYGQKLKKNTVSIDSAAARESDREDERRKAKADADVAVMKADKMRREMDDEWIHASTAWAAVAGIVGTLRDSLRHHLHASQAEIVHVAGGEVERTYEVFEYCEEIINSAFNDVAGGSIDINFDDSGD